MEKEIDVIIVFAFGKGRMINEALAKHARYLSERYEIPLYTQQDINVEMMSAQFKGRIFVADESDGRYLSTLGIVMQFRALAEKNGWKSAYLVAVPSHEWRCCKDLLEAGFRVFTDDYLRKIYSEKFWFRPDDPQAQVRSRFAWWKREIVLRALQIFFYPLYKKLAR